MISGFASLRSSVSIMHVSKDNLVQSTPTYDLQICTAVHHVLYSNLMGHC